jgi:hypothetical protein
VSDETLRRRLSNVELLALIAQAQDAYEALSQEARAAIDEALRRSPIICTSCYGRGLVLLHSYPENERFPYPCEECGGTGIKNLDTTEIAKIKAEERAAIVAFGRRLASLIRYNPSDSDSDRAADVINLFVDVVERGEHERR